MGGPSPTPSPGDLVAEHGARDLISAGRAGNTSDCIDAETLMKGMVIKKKIKNFLKHFPQANEVGSPGNRSRGWEEPPRPRKTKQ